MIRQTYTQTQAQTQTQTQHNYAHRHERKQTHARTNIRTHKYANTYTQTQTQTQHNYAHRHKRKQTHTRINTYAHTHTNHTYTHTHTHTPTLFSLTRTTQLAGQRECEALTHTHTHTQQYARSTHIHMQTHACRHTHQHTHASGFELEKTLPLILSCLRVRNMLLAGTPLYTLLETLTDPSTVAENRGAGTARGPSRYSNHSALSRRGEPPSRENDGRVHDWSWGARQGTKCCGIGGHTTQLALLMAGRRSLELLCLGEEDVLPHLGVILAQSKALGRGFRVFARDIEEARAGAAHQLDEDGLELSLRHLFCSH